MEFTLYLPVHRVATTINANQLQVSRQLDHTFAVPRCLKFETRFFESTRYKNKYPHFIGFQSAQIGRDNELSKDHLVEVHPFMPIFIHEKQGQLNTLAFFNYMTTRKLFIRSSVIRSNNNYRESRKLNRTRLVKSCRPILNK